MPADMTGWRPIETAPRDGTRLLLWNGDHVLGWFETAIEFTTRVNDWVSGLASAAGYDAGFDRVHGVTHWMPLPDPPAPDQATSP